MKKSEHILPEHYSSIDYLPMLAWNKIHETNDISFLLIKKQRLSKKQDAMLAKVWENIYDEYLLCFGYGSAFRAILEKQIEIAKLKIKKIIKKDESIQTFIDIAELKLSQMKKNNKGGDIYKTKAAIEKKMGIRIPMADTSVREFYSYLKDLK